MPLIPRTRPWQLAEGLATPEPTFLNRRQVLRGLGLSGAALALTPILGCGPLNPLAPPRGLDGSEF